MEDTVIKATRRENTCSFQKKTGLSNYWYLEQFNGTDWASQSVSTHQKGKHLKFLAFSSKTLVLRSNGCVLIVQEQNMNIDFF